MCREQTRREVNLLLLFHLKDLHLEEWVCRAQRKVRKENHQKKKKSFFILAAFMGRA